MRNNIVLIPLSKLKSHEVVDENRLRYVLRKIKTDGVFVKPIVVDGKNLVILDGHHRVAALKIMGAEVIPALLVDYKSEEIQVFLRRKRMFFTSIKDAVIKTALEGKVFPHKTTRHCLKSRLERINVRLDRLFRKEV